ncbi:MAG TPA: phasin family protein [Azospirillum sp.]|nr:phasin family protein [Azospirillum sp.]
MTARKARRRHAAISPMAVVGTLMRTAEQHGELGLAAARTIGYRTALMAGALQDPTKLTNPEFVLMGTEKVEAAAKAVHAFSMGMADLQDAWVSLCTLPVRTMSAVFSGGFDWQRAPMEVWSLNARIVEDTVVASMRFAQSAASLAGAGLAPIHRTASANARRLERRHGRA